jgi:hypothetical protein
VMCHEGGWQLVKAPAGGFDARAPDR